MICLIGRIRRIGPTNPLRAGRGIYAILRQSAQLVNSPAGNWKFEI